MGSRRNHRHRASATIGSPWRKDRLCSRFRVRCKDQAVGVKMVVERDDTGRSCGRWRLCRRNHRHRNRLKTKWKQQSSENEMDTAKIIEKNRKLKEWEVAETIDTELQLQSDLHGVKIDCVPVFA
ncbi:hypothetical protein L2E82_10101 [Cichorium intybus]|uniref:Uncharacterized protein n=1 Tax=Cichorium intybus TaxID=13427 RepID=A0ACB9GAQ4_CICIN|nr:hypothetical protein L2E82_10101 [Cichorium intybus]